MYSCICESRGIVAFFNLLLAVLPIQLSVHLTFAVDWATSTWRLSSATRLYNQLLLMLFPFQSQASNFSELHDVSIHLFLQPVVILLVGNSVLWFIKTSFEFGEFSEVECIPSFQLTMKHLIYFSPQNEKLYVAGWYCCVFFCFSLPLPRLVWLLNFKERKGVLSSSQGIYVLSRLFLCVEVLYVTCTGLIITLM